MAQEFHVVRCSTCQSFQVQQVKKVTKWSCKLCGQKQSLLKEFGRGSGSDCRRHVQKLNALRGAMIEGQERNTWSLWEQEEEEEEEEQRDDQVRRAQVSRWSKYLDEPQEVEPEEGELEGNVLMDRPQLHGNIRIDRKRKSSQDWTDRGPEDSCTPEQPNCLMKCQRTSATTTSLHPSSPPRKKSSRPSLHPSSPPRKKSSPPSLHPSSPPGKKPGPPSLHLGSPTRKKTTPPSVCCGLASRGFHCLISDCQAQEGEGPSGCGQSESFPDIVTRLRPLVPVSSMFESGEEFSFDDDFLTLQKV